MPEIDLSTFIIRGAVLVAVAAVFYFVLASKKEDKK